MTPFKSIAFDSPLPQNILNINSKKRSNQLPWRGQFSPQLVESLLVSYANSDSVVLDPFMGSGTVLVESARLSLSAHGYEINPAAYTLSRLYQLCNLDFSDRSKLLSEAEKIVAQTISDLSELPLFNIGDVISASKSENFTISTPSESIQILLDALVVLSDGKNSAYPSKWTIIKRIVSYLPYTDSKMDVSLCDARETPLPDGAIDFILSSPPYINVFNYHQNMRNGIESLGWNPLSIAKSEIGSNRKFRQNRFLTVIQYCVDMAIALKEIYRVCNDSARIMLIIGRESNVHKTPFFNSVIIKTLATEILNFHIPIIQERVFKNKFGKSIYEDILHLSPRPAFKAKESVIEEARQIGKKVLMGAMIRTPKDRLHYLMDAIDKTHMVAPSPILNISNLYGVKIEPSHVSWR